MSHRVASTGLLMILVACSGMDWIAADSSLKHFILLGATDVQITALRWNEWQISYHAPVSPTTWSASLGRNLEAQRWSSLDSAEYGALNRTYTRVSSFGFCSLWEWAFLHFDPTRPHVAHIRVRRWLAIRWSAVSLQRPA